jgi:hypothetical protein
MGVLKNAVSWQQPFPSVYPLTRSLTFYGSDYYYPGSIWSGSPGSYYHSDSGVLYEDALWGAYSSSLVSSNPPKATTEGDGVIEIRKHPQGCVTRTATLLAGGAVSESTSGRTPLLFVGAGLFLRYFLSGFNNPSSEGGGSVYLDVRAEDENGSSASVFSFTLSVPEFSYETGGSAQHQDIIDLSLPPNGTRRIYARLTSSCSECDFNGSIFSKPVDLVEPVVNMYDESICAGGVEISTDAHTPSRGHASFYNATGLPNKWHRVPNFFGLSASHGVSESLSNEAAFRHYLPQNGVLTVSSVDEIPVESTFSVAAVSSPYSWVEMPGPGSQTAYIRAWKYTATATGSHKVEVAFSNPLYYSDTTQSVEVRAWVDDDTLSSDPAARITVQTPIAVVSGFVTSPPSDPGANGTQYAILNDATGIFDGKTGTIATWHGSSSDNPWTFENVADGTVARQYVAVYIWDGKSWNEATTFPIVSLRVTLETGQSVSVIAHRGGNGPSCIDTLAAAYRLRVIPPT